MPVKNGFVQRSVMGAGQRDASSRRRVLGLNDALRATSAVMRLPPHRARVSASHIPPPIMKPPEARESMRVRQASKKLRTRPASNA